MLAHSVVAVMVLMPGTSLQVTMWALLYHYRLGRVRRPSSSALYFSLASFTTLGANELALPPGTA